MRSKYASFVVITVRISCSFVILKWQGMPVAQLGLLRMQFLQLFWFFVKLFLFRNCLVDLLFFNGMFIFWALVENFHGQPMIFLPWIVRGYVSVWVNMHFILVDILIWLQSYFRFCLIYRVFIERRVKPETPICDLFRSAKIKVLNEFPGFIQFRWVILVQK